MVAIDERNEENLSIFNRSGCRRGQLLMMIGESIIDKAEKKLDDKILVH